MNKIIKSSLLGATCVFLSSCYAGVGSMDEVPGLFYSNVKYAQNASGPVGGRMGEATCESILGLIATGDCSVKAAALNGGITNVSSVSVKQKNILGVYAKYTTVVTGR